MRKFILSAALVLAGATSAQAEPSQDEITEERNSYARIQLAAANAPGDAVSDAFIVEMMEITLTANAHESTMDPALHEELAIASTRLQQRVEAALMDEPILMTTIGNCHGRYLQGRDCAAHWARVAELAGDDGYLHFHLMQHAATQQDAALFARHAALAAEAGTFESSLAAIFAPVYARYLRVPDLLWPTDEDLGEPRYQAGVLAMATTTAFGLPAYQPVMRHCEAAEDEVRQLCVAVARRLVGDSSTLIDRMIGAAILSKLGSDQDKAWARERRRQDLWLSRALWALWALEDELDEAQNARYFEVLAEQGEMEAIHYANQALGRALEPPVDWQPSAYGVSER